MPKKIRGIISWVKKKMPSFLWRIILLLFFSIVVVLIKYAEIILLQTILARMGAGKAISEIVFMIYVLVLAITLVLPLWIEYYSFVNFIQPFICVFSELVSNALYFASRQQFGNEKNGIYRYSN